MRRGYVVFRTMHLSTGAGCDLIIMDDDTGDVACVEVRTVYRLKDGTILPHTRERDHGRVDLYAFFVSGDGEIVYEDFEDAHTDRRLLRQPVTVRRNGS